MTTHTSNYTRTSIDIQRPDGRIQMSDESLVETRTDRDGSRFWNWIRWGMTVLIGLMPRWLNSQRDQG